MACVIDSELRTVLAGVDPLVVIDAGLALLGEAGVDPVDDRDAGRLVERVERLGHRLDAVRVSLLDVIDRRGLFKADGHVQAKTMVIV